MYLQRKPNYDYPGFYHLEDFPDYLIDRSGFIINLKRNVMLSGSMNPAGYFHFRLKTRQGNYFTIGRHRLLCLTFKCEEGKDYSDLYVNHINGIPGDDELHNLEWVTSKENCEHAGEHGLSPKCLPVSVRDSLTGTITDYPSMLECSKALSLTHDAVKYRVKIGERRVFPELKQYRLKSMTSDWFIPDMDTAVKENSTLKEIQVRDVITGDIEVFESIKMASDALGVLPSYISEWLAIEGQPVTSIMKQFLLSTSEESWRELGDPYLEYSKFNRGNPVIVKNIKSGKEKIFLTAGDVSSYCNIGKSTLSFRLKTKGTKVYPDGNTYCYYIDRNTIGRL